MKLTYSEKYQALAREVRDFVARFGHLSPKPGGGRQKPSEKALDWQKRLLAAGYVARNIPKEYGGAGNRMLYITNSLKDNVLVADMPVAGEAMFGLM
jgi:alkylation response protein AidB-like acyl-CoA dehydrogenase